MWGPPPGQDATDLAKISPCLNAVDFHALSYEDLNWISKIWPQFSEMGIIASGSTTSCIGFTQPISMTLLVIRTKHE
jgi:hypothetical protein